MTIEEIRLRRRSPRKHIVVAPPPEIPASGATLVEHTNAVLLSTLRTEDLSARYRHQSPSRSRGSASPRNPNSSSPLFATPCPVQNEPPMIAEVVCAEPARAG